MEISRSKRGSFSTTHSYQNSFLIIRQIRYSLRNLRNNSSNLSSKLWVELAASSKSKLQRILWLLSTITWKWLIASVLPHYVWIFSRFSQEYGCCGELLKSFMHSRWRWRYSGNIEWLEDTNLIYIAIYMWIFMIGGSYQ